jgi:RNA polymerase sigma-70 factor, ECF subfamily
VSEQDQPEYADEIMECFRLMSGKLHKFLRAPTQGDKALADDLVQETFVKAWKNWPVLRGLSEEERGNWLIAVAFRTAVDAFRRGTTARAKLPQVYMRYGPAEADVHQEAMTSIAIRRFLEVIDGMPLQQAQAAFLRWRCGWSGREIAKALGISAGRVSQLLKAAKAMLRSELGPYVPFEDNEPEEGA